MRLSDNFRMAVKSIRSARMRSFLTLLGIIIGIVSVVTMVSLGEGVKRQISDQVSTGSEDLIVVTSNRGSTIGQDGVFNNAGLLSTSPGGSLSEQDLQTLHGEPGVSGVAPLSVISGVAKAGDRTYENGPIIATLPTLPSMIGKSVEFGGFFSDETSNSNVVVIGQEVATQLFREAIPLGKTINIRGQEFIVRGVFSQEELNSNLSVIDVSRSMFIPYVVGQNISENNMQTHHILARVDNPKNLNTISASLEKKLKDNHGGQSDFSVLSTDEVLVENNETLQLLTRMVLGIAAISLFVGGIGIMNVLLASVSERNREIGIRKAVGATNQQIWSQFLMEAVVLSVWGAFLGVIFSVLLNFGIRIMTNLEPVITWQISLVAVLVSVAIGIVFGTGPAIKAARKNPIEAFRSI